jgi:hypothetical protein
MFFRTLTLLCFGLKTEQIIKKPVLTFEALSKFKTQQGSLNAN